MLIFQVSNHVVNINPNIFTLEADEASYEDLESHHKWEIKGELPDIKAGSCVTILSEYMFWTCLRSMRKL